MALRFLSVLVTAVLVLCAGCSQQQEQEKSSQQNIQPAGNVFEVLTVEKRENRVPNFSWKDDAGNTVEFDAVRGKVALVNFWATWCGPCKRELPDLIALHDELAGRGITIIGISTDRGSNVAEDVRAFVKEQGIKYQVVVSTEELEQAFGNVRFLPTSFIVDSNGNIIQTYVGPRSKAFFADALLAAAK